LFGNYAFIGYSNQSQAIEFFKNFKFLFKNIHHKITPLKKEEIENIQNTINTYAPNVKLPFKNNSYTKISLAPFSGFIARITNMTNNSLTIQFKIKDIKIVGKIFHPFILECVK
jgi:transcription antitermination factor NusG